MIFFPLFPQVQGKQNHPRGLSLAEANGLQQSHRADITLEQALKS